MTYPLTLNSENVVVVQLVQYETIRIKVIDCRSGQPVTNSKVRRLVIRGRETIDTSFPNSSGRIDTGNAIKDSQEALKRLGFFTGTPATNYDASSRKAYNDFWNHRANGEAPQVSSGNPVEGYFALITKEYNCHFATDNQGILNVRIPQNYFDGHRVEIELGFWDCPIILEEIDGDARVNPIKRDPVNTSTLSMGWAPPPTPSPEAPQLIVEWSGEAQSTGWDDANTNWGWTARKNYAVQAPVSWMEFNNVADNATPIQFQYKLTLVVKSTADAFNDASTIDHQGKSFFFQGPYTNSPHFVIFALQWCQPVWDGIEDPQGELVAGSSNENVYIQNPEYAHMNMHVVTRAIGNSRKTYGTTRHGADRYDAIDLHTITGSSELFAVHQGSTDVRDNALSAAGRYVILSWNNDLRRIRYLHMHSISVLNNENVLPGTILGIAGRTGNFSPLSARNAQNNFEPDSQYPDHCHMDDGYNATGSGILSNRNELDWFNQKCLPNYSFPLLFPCACEVSEEDSNPEGCNFSNNSFVSTCWAVAELKCPHMNGESATDRRIQAQLKFLNYYLGNIDGVFGPIPTSLNTASGTRRAIYRFKEDRGLMSSDQEANFVLGLEDLMVLNQDAPVIEF